MIFYLFGVGELRELENAYKKEDETNAARICNNLGDLFSKMENYEDALSYHKKELELCDGIKDTGGKAIAHRKIGECLASLQKYKEALKEVQKYLKLARLMKDEMEVQRALTTEGRVWYMRYTIDKKMEHLVNAKEAYGKAMAVCDRLDHDGNVRKKDIAEMRVGLFINLALVAEEKEDYDTAMDYYSRASTLGE